VLDQTAGDAEVENERAVSLDDRENRLREVKALELAAIVRKHDGRT
jgi:hypothetical protein